MKVRNCFENVAVISLVIAASFAPEAVQADVYWTNYAVYRVNNDGSGLSAVVPNTYANAMAVDPLNRKIYWCGGAGGNDITSANYDGSGVSTVCSYWDGGIGGESIDNQQLAIDPTNDKMAFLTQTGFNGMELNVANLDGSGVVTLEKHMTNYGPLALYNGEIYWVNQYGNDDIYRMNEDGTGLTDLIPGAGAYDLAIDSIDGKIYWTGGAGGNDITCASLDGTGVKTVLTEWDGGASESIENELLAIDPASQKMAFFTLTGANGTELRVANLDGTGDTLLQTKAAGAYGIAIVDVVPEPSSTAILTAGALCILGYSWRRRAKRSGPS